jgi:catechol 2,3-dioxygenase-like lactoylglutathione lyase family enzyme
MITKMMYWIDQWVYDVDKAIETYGNLFGWKPAVRWDLESWGLTFTYLPIGLCPGGFSIGGHALSLEGPLGPKPHEACKHMLGRRGEGFGIVALLSDDPVEDTERMQKMGVDVVTYTTHDTAEDIGYKTEYNITEKETHGLFVNIPGGGLSGTYRWFTVPGAIQKVVVEPEKLPQKGVILSMGHIVHAVKNLDEGLNTYEKLFRLKPSNRWEFTDAGINSAFIRIGDRGIQLVVAQGTKSYIAHDIQNNLEQYGEYGEGLNHCVLITDDLKAFTNNMEAKGVKVTESTMGGKPDVWVPRKYTHGILYQVVEPEDYFSHFRVGKL